VPWVCKVSPEQQQHLAHSCQSRTLIAITSSDPILCSNKPFSSDIVLDIFFFCFPAPRCASQPSGSEHDPRNCLFSFFFATRQATPTARRRSPRLPAFSPALCSTRWHVIGLRAARPMTAYRNHYEAPCSRHAGKTCSF
jgi:hypothetical protein